jgi:hypothetical protein
MDGIGLLGGMEWSGPAIGTFTYVMGMGSI